MKLSVFDLLVARGYAQGVELRSLIEEVRESFALLDEFDIDPYHLLRVDATGCEATNPEHRAAVERQGGH